MDLSFIMCCQINKAIYEKEKNQFHKYCSSLKDTAFDKVVL